MKKHLTVFILCAGIVVALGLGCAPVKTIELVGTYRANLPAGEETLKLLPNGECVQEIRLSDGKTYFARGHWRYDAKAQYLSLDGTRIPLIEFGEMNPDIARIPEGSTGTLPVGRGLLGDVEIGVSEDVIYRKIVAEQPKKQK